MAINLRTPEKPPELVLDTKVSVRRAMNGDLYGYKGDSEVYQQRLNVKLFHCGDDRDKFIQFLETVDDDKFTYIDSDGDSWTVRLVRDPTRIIEEAKNYDRAVLVIEGTKDG